MPRLRPTPLRQPPRARLARLTGRHWCTACRQPLAAGDFAYLDRADNALCGDCGAWDQNAQDAAAAWEQAALDRAEIAQLIDQ